ncbi:MAG TPA: LPS export ABC transporter periplasmic protein LptC [Saprospiraceae bacterium]|nr:LPS export ABC transporter periplasmic protein LptC [Saprospiraceae bacterium]
MKNFFTLSFLFLALASCVVEEPDLSRYIGSKIDNVEEARDIEVKYTDSSYLVFILKAPLTRRSLEKYAVEEEFPEGLEVTFYDKTGNARSWLRSDYARRDQINRKIIIQKNVVLHNDRGQRLDAPELIWDEKTKEIYTDRFVKITDHDKTIFSYGFRSNEAFTRYELHSGSGDMKVEEGGRSE